MKARARAHPNIAIVKYWGKADEKLNLPLNSSISLTLSDLYSETEVEFTDAAEDQICLNGVVVQDAKITAHLDLIRRTANLPKKAVVNTTNNFPLRSGIASSASGFAALTVATCAAAGLKTDLKQLSILARQGSGSACRSIYGGFVEWQRGTTSNDSNAVQLVDENHWDVRDLIAIVSTQPKKVGSTAGMIETARTSPMLEGRLREVEKNLDRTRRAIFYRDIATLGEVAEYDTLLMHAAMMTSKPPLFYWLPPTLEILQAVQALRDEKVPAYFSIDAGANVHVLTLPDSEGVVDKKLRKIKGVSHIYRCRPGGPACLIDYTR